LRTLFICLFALTAIAIAGPRPALAQRVVTHSSSLPLNFSDMAGPPGPAALRDQRMAQVQKMVGDAGLSTSLNKEATSAVDRSHDFSFPDAGAMLPTTREPAKLSNSLQIVILLSLLTLAPSILLMCTCFTRVVIVMSLLRQALGANQLPPNQVMIGLSLFITFLVMTPTWNSINEQAITPYRNSKISQMTAIDRGVGVLREFMINQIVAAHNEDDVYLFYSYANNKAPLPDKWEQVGTTTLVPAYVLSELKVAFLLGFQVYLPFLIIDMVIASVLISIGMQLLPPAMVSLPFKLLLFVLVDGWHLIAGLLLNSFTLSGHAT
jgi:flagellar biosynthetic protein FliP